MKKKSKKIIIILILVVAAVLGYEFFINTDNTSGGTTPIPPATQDFDVSVLNNQIVLIKHTSNSYVNYGSGVVVSMDETKTYILTNAHVLDNLGSVEVINGALQIVATVVTDSWDYELDMVLLSIPKNDVLIPVSMSTTYAVGSLVFAAGYINQAYDISAGLITAVKNNIINSNATIQPGQSGSGLFNSEMQFVGLNKQYVVDANGAWLSTISIKVETIISYLDLLMVT